MRRIDLPLFGGTLVPDPLIAVTLTSSDAPGSAVVTIPVPITFAAGAPLYFQHAMLDASAPLGVAMTHGVRGTAP